MLRKSRVLASEFFTGGVLPVLRKLQTIIQGVYSLCCVSLRTKTVSFQDEDQHKVIAMEKTVLVKKLKEKAILPTYGTEFSAGADLYACLTEPVAIKPGEAFLVPTGLSMEIPEGFAGLIFARSGLATKQGLAPANKVGVIDADYRGEILVCLLNHSMEERTVLPGQRIAQMVITPYLQAMWQEAQELPETARGSGGFGSTGAFENPDPPGGAGKS